MLWLIVALLIVIILLLAPWLFWPIVTFAGIAGGLGLAYFLIHSGYEQRKEAREEKALEALRSVDINAYHREYYRRHRMTPYN